MKVEGSVFQYCLNLHLGTCFGKCYSSQYTIRIFVKSIVKTFGLQLTVVTDNGRTNKSGLTCTINCYRSRPVISYHEIQTVLIDLNRCD